jgi:hypothetical protein
MSAFCCLLSAVCCLLPAAYLYFLMPFSYSLLFVILLCDVSIKNTYTSVHIQPYYLERLEAARAAGKVKDAR